MQSPPPPSPSHSRTGRGIGAAVLAAVTVAALLAPAAPATADPSPADPATAATPSRATSASPSTSPSTGAEQATPTPALDTDPSASPGASAAPAPGTSPRPSTTQSPPGETEDAAEVTEPVTAQGTRAIDAPLTLSITAADTPVPGRFFEDIGAYAMKGQVDDAGPGRAVHVYRRGKKSGWARVTSTRTGSGGTYSARLPVTARGTFWFRSTLGGAPSAEVPSSNEVSVVVNDSRVGFTRVDNRIDARKNTRLVGSVVPARPGVKVSVQVRRSGGYADLAQVTTDAAGRFSTVFSYGRYHRNTYAVRAIHRAANRDRIEVGKVRKIRRVAVINAVVRRTTAADVEHTYHAGCPVGRSRLRTIDLNFVTFDGTVDRGVIIVRSTVVTEVIRGFRKALRKGYPIAKMNNPNVYGGNDPTQMAANNTSGFNCRRVVGNPYRMSPHSYGTAIDVNPVQNPYRDINGRWWPPNGKKYIDRTPRRRGMLTRNSTLTKQLRRDGFFWGGFWSPGRDYQHFQR